MVKTKILSVALVTLVIISSVVALASVGNQIGSAQAQTTTLSYPLNGQISYGSTTSYYTPWTRKEAVVPAFMSLTVKYGGSYESIGKSSSPYDWDIVLFKFGNPNGAPLLITTYTHGNEFYPEEALYSIMNWLLSSSDSYAREILQNNYVLVVPVVNYRWGRTNYDKPSWMTAYDPSGDGGKDGVNLNRNFSPGWQTSLSHSNTDAYSGTEANSEKETQALIYVWNKYHPRIYWDIHSGASPATWAAAASSQAKIDANKIKTLLGSIQTSLGVTSGRWTFSICYGLGGGGYTYFGAAQSGIAGFQSEIMYGWSNTASKKTSLDSGATFKQVKAMFIAMCKAI